MAMSTDGGEMAMSTDDISLYISEKDVELLSAAADALGQSVQDFVFLSAYDAAKLVLEKEQS